MIAAPALSPAAAAAERRLEERSAAWDFLTTGEAEGPSPDGEPWSRDYDPRPYADAVPDARLYAGTGIGALYGFSGSARFLWQLAGWNITRRGRA